MTTTGPLYKYKNVLLPRDYFMFSKNSALIDKLFERPVMIEYKF